MPRRILIPLLIAPVAAFCFQDTGPGLPDAGSRAPLSVAGVVGQEGDFVCGECQCPEPEDRGGRQQAAVSAVVAAHEDAAVRRALNDSPGHGPGPVLGSLSDCLILSRPPPAASAGTRRARRVSRCEPRDTDKETTR